MIDKRTIIFKKEEIIAALQEYYNTEIQSGLDEGEDMPEKVSFYVNDIKMNQHDFTIELEIN